MTKTLEIDGFDELLRAIDTAPQTARPLLRQAMQRALLLVKAIVADYPPATEANRPGRMTVINRGKRNARMVPMGYYERGQGWWYPVVNRATFAGVKGKSAGVIALREKVLKKTGRVIVRGTGQRIVGYKLRRVSEVLGKSWATAVTPDEDGVTGEIGNNASYAPEVQSADRQWRVHAMRGWGTLEKALEDATPEIIDEFEKGVEELLEKLGDE